MKRLLYVLLVLAVIGGGYYLITLQAKEPAVLDEVPEGFQLAAVERGPIEAVVNGTGSLSPERTVAISFAATGKVVEVLVQEGDTLESGQVMARLDDEDLLLSLKQSEVALEIAKAQLALTTKGPSEEEVSAAEAALESANASLDDIEAGASWRDKQLSKLSIDQAKNSLWGAQGSRDAIKGQPFADGGQVTQAEASVANAELAVEMAELQYAKLFEEPMEGTLAAARAQIAQAESSLARLRSMPSDEDVALAEAQVRQAQLGVDMARKRLDDVNLESPAAGTLVVWDLYVNDMLSPGVPLGTLLDDSHYYVELSIDETEIAQIRVGQRAHIVLDAYMDDTIEGTVVEIETVGVNMAGIVAYGVKVELNATDLELKPQMTAGVDIVVDRREDVVLVPNRALRRDSKGKYVEVLKLAVPSKVYIETGVSSEAMTEVLSGLEPGQEVITSRPQSNVFGGPFGG